MTSQLDIAHLEETYTGGKCFALAFALNYRYGWPIEAKIERYAGEDVEYAAHVWVVHPSGQALDITGFSDRAAIAASYGTPKGETRIFTSNEFLEFTEAPDSEDDDFDPEDTYWDDVEAARWAIDDYLAPRFLTPLETGATPDPAPGGP